jgi:Tfp pilus assembly protein PilF
VRAHLYCGRALDQTNQPDAALREFQEVVRLDPRLPKARFELAQLELRQKRPEDARTDFQQALALDPKLAQAELGEAFASEALNDNAQAATAVLKAEAESEGPRRL